MVADEPARGSSLSAAEDVPLIGRALRAPVAGGRYVAAQAPVAEPATKVGKGGLAPCLFYLFIDFSRPMAWVPPLALIRPGLIAGLWGFSAVLLRRERPIPKALWPVLGLIALMAWNVPWAVNNRWAFWGFQDFSILVLGGVLPLALLPRSVDAVRTLLAAYVFLHVPTAIYALLHQGRGLDGWMGDENDLALALTVAIGMGVYLLIEARSKRNKILLVVALGIMVAAVVASHSRSGFVGLVVLAAYMMFFGPHRKAVAYFSGLTVLGLMLLAPASYWDEARSIRGATKEGDTGETRFYFWGIARKMYLDHPITGVGTNNFGIRSPEYQDPNRKGWNVHTWGRVAHSLYFTLIAEQGTIGTLLFAAALWSAVKTLRTRRAAWKRDQENHDLRNAALLASSIMCGMVGVLATGTFLSVLYYPPLWVLLGLMSALDATTAPPGTDQAKVPRQLAATHFASRNKERHP